MNIPALIEYSLSIVMSKTLIVLGASLAAVIIIVLAFFWRKQKHSHKQSDSTPQPTAQLKSASDSEPISQTESASQSESSPQPAGPPLPIEPANDQLSRADVSELEPLTATPSTPLGVNGCMNTLTQLEASMAQIQEELSEVRQTCVDVSDRLNLFSDSLKAVLVNVLREEKQKERESEEQRQLEEQEQREQQVRLRHEEIVRGAREHFENLTKEAEILQIATATRDLLQELSDTQPDLGKNFPDYVVAADKAEALERAFADPNLLSSTNGGERLEAEITALAELVSDLAHCHRPAWFTSLLDQASKHPQLQLKADELRSLLKLEEVWVEPGSAPADLSEMDVVDSNGLGKTPVISEVLEHGYRLSDTGVVVRRPKVRVRFEV
jgi:hypothetical protein